ncbi:fused MFS/spermidine synthase [Candidatus Peregrinibacteria bacterium]|nr:MAG: fused MFS/spermidine synthase [Candidatus Peregrinibacteria bacterium]
MKSRFVYFVSAALCGAVVMGVELSASRLLAPYFGNSLYVWTNVIAVVLLALAGGYFYGGKLADRRPEPKLYFSLIAATGFWILLIPFLIQFFSEVVVSLSPNLAFAVRLGSLFIAALFFLLPLFMLGMMVPFTLKLLQPSAEHVASVSGRLSMVSTLGSLVGTFLPTFFLIPLLGTTKTFLVLGFVLLFLAVYGLKNRLFWVRRCCCSVFFCLYLTFMLGLT